MKSLSFLSGVGRCLYSFIELLLPTEFMRLPDIILVQDSDRVALLDWGFNVRHFPVRKVSFGFSRPVCRRCLQLPITSQTLSCSLATAQSEKVSEYFISSVLPISRTYSPIRHLKMKNRKNSGEDRITSETIKIWDKVILQSVQILLRKCLTKGRIPNK